MEFALVAVVVIAWVLWRNRNPPRGGNGGDMPDEDVYTISRDVDH